ncbi:MAG TPA: MarR family transcriptional regulator [Candidatus Limnocylindrales bacterium]|nr:MarR family transcriptional regulator [Candidatus Limnocylindrales bacterium]
MSTVPDRQHPVKEVPPESAGRTPAGDAFSALVARVFRLNGLLAAAGDALSRPAGQSSARWQVLAILEGEPATVASIARVLGLARQSVQRIADILEGEGLIRYVENPRHRRARLAQLSAEGRIVLAAIQAAQRPWADRVGGAVGAPSLRRATATLDALIAALE